MKRTRLRKQSKDPKAKLRAKADKLLMDYIRLKHKDELCWVCGNKPISCGHHFIPKKNSNALRFYLPNIIPICRDCHSLVHTQPHLVEPKICFKLGQEWHEDLMERKRAGIKYNTEWIQTQFSILTDFLQELRGEK